MAKKKDKSKMRKNIDVDIDTVKIIAKKAIDEGSNFKNLTEKILQDYAKKTKL